MFIIELGKYLMNFRMNDLENFMVVASSAKMSEAAKKLGISQPALSESIKRLETDLGEVLLYRARSGSTLTPNGRAVIQNAKAAHSFLSEIESLAANESKFGSRMITIGCHATVASYYMPKTLKNLENVVPDYKINLKHGFSRNIQTGIQQGLIDIGIVVNPTPSPDLIIRQLNEDEIAVWTAKNGSKNKVFCNEELAQTQSILRKWKNSPAVKINTDSLELIVRLTSAGLGFGIIPACTVRLLEADLKRVEGTPSFRDSICIVYRPEFGKSEIEKKVIESIKLGTMRPQ
jgi:DNA-binding transcriptional LysR family regulator